MRKYWVQLALGVATLALIVKLSLNLEKLSGMRFSWSYFFLSVLAYSALNALLSIRLKVLLGGVGVEMSFIDALKAHVLGMLAGDVTPGRSGYVIAAKIVSEMTGCEIEKPTVAVIAPQGIEFMLKGLGALLAILYLLRLMDVYVAVAALLMVSLGVAISVLFFTSEGLSVRIFGCLPWIGDRISLLDVKDHGKMIVRFLPHILAIYFLGWLSVGLQWYLISKSLALDLTYLQTFLLHPLVTALSFIPVTP